MYPLNILEKSLKYLDNWKDIEKLENINNDFNYKLKYIYKNSGLNFKDHCDYIDLKKLIKKYNRIYTLDLYSNTNITDEGLKSLKGVHTLYLSSNTNITDEGLKSLKGAKCVYANKKRMI